MPDPPGYALDADGGERLEFGGVTILVRVSAESTGGALSVLEEIPPMLDTPMHVHANEHEVFHVLEGEHILEVGDEEFRVGPGEMVFAPRGVPHSQRRVEPGVGRLLVVTAPGGLERFFRDLVAADRAGTLNSGGFDAASEKHGITWLR